MSTEWNTEKIIRTSKILACLHGVLGVWMIVLSAIVLKTSETDGVTWWLGGIFGLIGGTLMMINFAVLSSCLYLAFKGLDMGNDVTIKGIRIMMRCSGWLSFLLEPIVVLPIPTSGIELNSKSVSKSDSKSMRTWLCINQIIVGSLGLILALSAGFLALMFAKYFSTATFMTSRVEPSRQIHQPLKPLQRELRGYSRGEDLPSPSAFTISHRHVNENVNNSMNREPTPPPSYVDLSVHSSVISNYRASSTYSAHGTPPPKYSSVMQTMTSNNRTPPPSYINLSFHSSVIPNYRASSTYSADGTAPPNYSSVMQTITGNNRTPPPNYDNLSVHSSFISNYIASPTYRADETPPPSFSSVTQAMTGTLY